MQSVNLEVKSEYFCHYHEFEDFQVSRIRLSRIPIPGIQSRIMRSGFPEIFNFRSWFLWGRASNSKNTGPMAFMVFNPKNNFNLKKFLIWKFFKPKKIY